MVTCLDDLAVDDDPTAERIKPIGRERGMLAPPHPRVGDEKDLELAPPDLGALSGGSGEGVHSLRGWYVRLVDVHTPFQIILALAARDVPVDTPQDVLAGEQQAFLQPRRDHG